jgi:hypothetical protein
VSLGPRPFGLRRERVAGDGVQHRVVPDAVVVLRVADRQLRVQHGFAERAQPVFGLPEKTQRLLHA